MPIKNYKKEIIMSSKENDFNRFNDLPEDYIEKLSEYYFTLKKISNKYIRSLAVHQISTENSNNFEKMTFEEKEELIAQREKDLFLKIKNGCTTTLALVLGISIGG